MKMLSSWRVVVVAALWIVVVLVCEQGARARSTHNTMISGRVHVPIQLGGIGNQVFRISMIGSNGSIETLSLLDGSFTLYDVSPGKYALSVINRDLYYGKYQVVVEEGQDSTSNNLVTKIYDVTQPGKTVLLPKANILEPKSKFQYFEQRQQVSIMSFFMNPMGIMMLITLVMVVVMPKLMENLSPEELKEAQEKMANQQDPNKVLQDLFGGGGKKGEEDEDSD